MANDEDVEPNQIPMVCTSGDGGDSVRRTMSPSLPPHHHIRADDTNEMEHVITHDSVKSTRRYYSTTSDHTPLSLHQRLVAQLQIKSRFLSWCMYITILILFIILLLLAAFGIYWILNSYYSRKPIPVKTSKCKVLQVDLQCFNPICFHCRHLYANAGNTVPKVQCPVCIHYSAESIWPDQSGRDQ